MTAQAIAMMTAVCTIVWGGFAGFLIYVIKKEHRKHPRGAASDSGRQP